MDRDVLRREENRNNTRTCEDHPASGSYGVQPLICGPKVAAAYTRLDCKVNEDNSLRGC